MKLFWKIYVAVVIPCVLISCLFAYVIAAYEISLQQKHAIKVNALASRLITREVKKGRIESKWPFDSLNSLSEHGDFLFWWIVRDDGTIHLANDTAFIGTYAHEYFPQIEQATSIEKSFLDRERNRGVFVKSFGKTDKWSFWLGFSLKELAALQRKIIQFFVLLLMLTIGMHGVTVYFIVKHFTKPIKTLAEGVTAIGTGNLEHRVQVESKDELGYLARSFNDMAEHLKMTTTSVNNLNREIAERKRAEVELKTTQEKLLEVARKAGMAEVAADVLHNVGNVLNSINVSTTLITEKVAKSEVANMQKVASIINEHIDEIGTFLTEHPQGKHIPTYLAEVSKCLQAEQSDIIGKLHVLADNVQHIKDIISMQQAYAKVSGVSVEVSPSQLVEDAIQINSAGLQRHGTRLEREFQELPNIEIDRQRVLQILVNLISNAKYALSGSDKEDKLLTIRIYRRSEDRFQIEVADNGVGIPKENLTKVFSHGFTTKQHGHGFGLHSSALAAKELGGALTVHSDGLGKGARFTLELPFKPVEVMQ